MTVKGRIAFVANTSWSIYKFRLYLIERLLKEGFTIYVLAPRDPYTEKFEQLKGLTFIQLHHFHPKSISPLRDFRLYRELLHHYRTTRPHLIFHYTIKANLYGTRAAARAGIPSISVITGLGYTFSGEGWLQRGVRVGYRRQLRKATEVWFLNEDDRKVFTTQHLVPADKTFLLPGEGVDTDYFHPAPYDPQDPKPTITFLLIGRLIRHKGIIEFVEAAKQLKRQQAPVQCQLLGFFDDESPVAIPRDQLKDWIAGGVITWLGHADDVRPFIEKADCIVLPSYREGMPLSLLEGASMSKALIATDTAGCRDLIEAGVNGYLCRTKDSTDLAAKMAAYLNLSPYEKKQMGLSSREHILQRYTSETVAAIYLEKIKTLGVTPPQY
jgi:glycosyltransferase involved in cell wall biosynthesis